MTKIITKIDSEKVEVQESFTTTQSYNKDALEEEKVAWLKRITEIDELLDAMK